MTNHAHKTHDSEVRSTIKDIEQHLKSGHGSEHAFDEVWKDLNKLRQHDLKGSGNFHQDLDKINKQLHKDGYLPHIKLVDDGHDLSMWENKPAAKASGGHSHRPNPAEAQRYAQGVQTEYNAAHNGGRTHGSDSGGVAYRPGQDGHWHGTPGSDTGSGADRTGSGVSFSRGEQGTANQIMDSLIKDHGLSAAGAAAVVGNMMQENSLSTEFNAGGGGLCQWTGSRKQDLINYANAHGESPTSVDAQVGFMMHELQTQYPGLLNELKSTNNAQQAAVHFEQQFERAGKPMNGNRMANASHALQEYVNA